MKWMRYFGIITAFAGIGTKVFSWLQQSQADESPGGDDITSEEVVQLAPILNEAINTGLQAAGVPIVAQVTLTYIGD